MTPVHEDKKTIPKSWKKVNEYRKALKKKRKQENVIKQLEDAERLKEVMKKTENSKKKCSPSTIAIALPGSILENAQSPELRSYLAGQIARAACIFRLNEIIVFDDIGIATVRETKRNYDDSTGENKTVRKSSLQLARILQYLECPQYLRKFFFPLHNDLKYCGLLNPLDAPHHMRTENIFPYREGYVLDLKGKNGQSYVNVGLYNDVLVDKSIESGMRVTVQMNGIYQSKSKKLRGTVVSPDEPPRETGVYWGYTVRICNSLAEVFTKSPYNEGYDLTIGTSDKGSSIRNIASNSVEYNHLLIVFGGLRGLESALSCDEKLNVDSPKLLFDLYLNVLPNQGSRTIRTEEAILITMSALQEKLNPKVPYIDENFKDLLPQSEDTGIQLNDAVGVKNSWKITASNDMSRFD